MPDLFDPTVEVALGADPAAAAGTWTWTDATAYVRRAAGITIHRGRTGNASSASPQTLALTVDNSDGRWTARNALGAWYGQIRRGTPIRVLIDGDPEFEGFIDSIPKVWDQSLNDCTAPLTAAGYLRRLAKSDRPLRSALYRALTSADYSQPDAYWPMEDGSTAAAFLSASGGQAMPFTGITPASYAGCAGSGSLPTLSATTLATGSVPVPSLFSWPGVRWSVRFVVNVPSTPASDVYPLGWYTSGSLTWRVVITALNQIRVEAFDSTFTEKLSATLQTYTPGRATMVGIDAVQNGANIDWTTTHYPGVTATGSVAGQAVGRVVTVRIGDSAALASGSVGHIAVYTGSSPPPVNAVVDGWAGSTVYSRINGLCDDAGIPVQITDGTPTTLMGPQTQTNLLVLVQTAETADLGLLSEAGFGLEYMSRWERYNRDVDLELDFEQGHVDGFAPIDDSQNTVNDIEVSRPQGSTYRYADEDHVALYGRDDTREAINVYTDSDLPFQAQWRVWLGTVDEDRLPAVGLNFARAPGILDAWRQRVVGSRMTIDNPPDEFGPDQVDVHIEGWQQTITPDTWTAQVYTSPARPWRVWSADHGWDLDTAGSTTTAALTSTATAVNVVTPSGPLWDTTVTHDVDIEGEHCQATVGVRDLFARTVASGWGSEPTGLAYTTSGGSASDYAVAAGVGTHSLGSVNVRRTCLLDIGSTDVDYTADVMITQTSASGASITQWAVARAADINNCYIARLDVATSGAVTLALFKLVAGAQTTIVAAVTVAAAHVASEWWRIRLQCTGSTIQARAWVPASQAEPGSWQVTVTDTDLTTGTQIGLMSRLTTGNTDVSPVIVSWDHLAVASPQRFVLVRSVNGVVKAHSSDVSVSLWRPRVPAL